MNLIPWRVPANRWLEPLLALIIAGGIVYTMGYLYTQSRLPQPYFYMPSDTFMDWFNVAGWARDRGA